MDFCILLIFLLHLHSYPYMDVWKLPLFYLQFISPEVSQNKKLGNPREKGRISGKLCFSRDFHWGGVLGSDWEIGSAFARWSYREIKKNQQVFWQLKKIVIMEINSMGWHFPGRYFLTTKWCRNLQIVWETQTKDFRAVVFKLTNATTL